MKTTLVRAVRVRRSGAFTLLEMLVVVTIIALLSALAAVQVNRVLIDAHAAQTLTVAMELKNGISSYQLDYNRFPLEARAVGDEDMPEFLTDGSNPMVDALLGVPPAAGGKDLNPLRTKYVEFKPAQGDRNGIVGTDVPRRFHDRWGQPFRIVLDTNGDNQVKNPDLASSDPKISQGKPEYLPVQVAVYSVGSDRVAHSRDDVASWRK
ncbi:MAG TPA: type II secretion system protein [Prosthecobacter sp.]